MSIAVNIIYEKGSLVADMFLFKHVVKGSSTPLYTNFGRTNSPEDRQKERCGIDWHWPRRLQFGKNQTWPAQ